MQGFGSIAQYHVVLPWPQGDRPVSGNRNRWDLFDVGAQCGVQKPQSGLPARGDDAHEPLFKVRVIDDSEESSAFGAEFIWPSNPRVNDIDAMAQGLGGYIAGQEAQSGESGEAAARAKCEGRHPHVPKTALQALDLARACLGILGGVRKGAIDPDQPQWDVATARAKSEAEAAALSS